jgi:[ribosomal protein S5]-alanine N-acetyltransferase
MGLDVLEALAAGDLERATSLAPSSLPRPLPSFLVSDFTRGTWRRRLDVLAAGGPEQAPWISRLIVYEPESGPAVIVGNVGFHGGQHERGVVEVGYQIDPAQRRK